MVVVAVREMNEGKKNTGLSSGPKAGFKLVMQR
jgi:hypothetical protein